jgi:ABC-type multidrug transport system ATPase subunit
MKHAIRTIDLTKVYGKKTAVNAVTLTVEEGELFALLGTNGAGKTTTIKMLTCLSRPTSRRPGGQHRLGTSSGQREDQRLTSGDCDRPQLVRSGER